MKTIKQKFFPIATSILVLLTLSACGETTPATTLNQNSDSNNPGVTSLTPNIPVNSTDITSDTATSTSINKTSDTIHEETSSLIVDAVYPITGNATVDSALKSFVENQIDAFKKEAPEIPADSYYQQNSIYISFTRTKLFGEDKYQSFQFDISIFTGGAHPNTTAQTMTFNMETAQQIKLADVFLPNTNYIKKLSTLSQESLKQQMPDLDQDMLEAGTSPIETNFQSWTFDNHDLVLHFDPYQVAPYAAGPQIVSIKLSDISNLLNPDFAKATPPSIPGTLTASRAADPNCQWQEFPDAQQLGLRMLAENCPNGPYFGIRNGIIVTHYETQKINLASLPDSKFTNVVEIFSKPLNQSPEDAIKTNFINKLSAQEQKECTVQASPENSHSGVRAYIIQPSEQYMQDMFGSNNSEQTPDLCGAYGMSNGLQYFEFQDFNTEKYLFIRAGQDTAPFDEKNIYILPQKPVNTTITEPKVKVTNL